MTANQSNTISAVEMKRRIQEQMYNETRDMTPAELLVYFRTRIANSQFANFLALTEPAQPQLAPSKKAE